MNKADKTKQYIIEQAALIFNEKGIAGTSIDDILKASQVAKGCLYGHFESKEELSHASVDYILGKMTERRKNALSKHKTARGKITAFMELNKNPLDSFFKGGCPIVNFSTETDDTNPVVKEKIRIMLSSAMDEFTMILRDGIMNGEFSDRLEPKDFVIKMFMSIEGANALCRTLNTIRPMQVVIKSLKAELDTNLLVNADKVVVPA